MEPALTPVMQWIGIWRRSNTSRTPAWAIPRAKPPPNASPILGGMGAAGNMREPFGRTKFCRSPNQWPTFSAALIPHLHPINVEWTTNDSDEQIGCQVPSWRVDSSRYGTSGGATASVHGRG